MPLVIMVVKDRAVTHVPTDVQRVVDVSHGDVRRSPV